MGNKQSQSSDEEEKEPSYRYHENVLRNAQLLTTEKKRLRSEIPYESDNEEYFSAEDGDSDRSITPPRTRPESSSGEDFSNDSMSEEEEHEQEAERVTSHSSVKACQSNASLTTSTTVSPGHRILRSNRTCGRCNVSSFEEHDSIGPELETSRWHLSDSSMASNRSNANSQALVPSKNSSVAFKRLPSRGFAISPFVPIRSPPQSLNASNSGVNQSLHQSSGVDASQTIETEGNQTSKGKLPKQVSPRKRGLGHFDSSDSDEDVEKVSRGSKRRTRHSRSPRCSTTSAHAIAVESTRGISGKSVGDDVSFFTRPRKVIDKQALSKVIASPVKRTYSGERYELENAIKKTRGGDDPGAKSIGGGADIRVSENFPQMSEGDVVVSDSMTVRKGSRSGAHVESFGCVHANEIAPPVNTSKMGSNGMRNSQGKLLPLHKRSDADQIDENKFEECESEVSGNGDLSSLSGIVRNLRQGKKMINEKTLSGQCRGNSKTGFYPVGRNDVVCQAQKNPGDAFVAIQHLSSDSSEALSSVNPLANVVLTPPLSPDASLTRTCTHQGDNTSPTTSLASRIKKTKQSAADRFKKLLTEGAGFKSIFSPRSKLTPEKATKLSLKAASLSSTSFSPSTSGLFNDSNHVHFSSSPAEPSSSQCSRPRSPSHFRDSGDRWSPSPSSTLNSVSPIFASLPVSSAPPGRLEGEEKRRYSSILEMSAEVRKRDSQSQHKSQSPGRSMSTRKSPRFQHSNSQSESAVSPVCVLLSSAEVQILPRVSQFQVLHFRLADVLEISVSLGDIADETSAGIVNWTDESLSHMVTECSRQIAARAGALMRAGCADYLVNKGAVLEAPDVLTTPAGGRFPKSVEALLHVVTPKLMKTTQPAHAMTTRLLEVYANCLRFANERLGLRSLSLPLIGQDLFTVEVSIKTFLDSILIFLVEGKSKTAEPLPSFDLASIHLVISDATTTDLAAELLTASLRHIVNEGIETIAKEAFSGYYNSSPSMSHEMESVDRARSGRPRMKRPKF